jgi:xanthine dehydrogenase YagS FAD-binding subunit
MNTFNYVTPRTPASAIALVRDHGRFLAGGMDLLGEMKEKIATPATLVNVKAIPDTGAIRLENGRCTIGTNVTLAGLVAHADLGRTFPALVEAAAEVGSPQIRNRATVGGNLAQHSRCWYYRHRDVECRKKGGKTCFAREGECKFHSLFTGSMCLSPLVSNLAVALAALDARIVVQRGAKMEIMSLAQLYATAWRTPTAHNSLREDDLILRVEVPAAAGTRSAYLQLSEKSDFDWALVSCAASAKIVSGKFSAARIVLGAVAPIPWQVEEAGRFLEGKPVTTEVADQAADMTLREARAFRDNAYKIPIARALVRRALLKLAA